MRYCDLGAFDNAVFQRGGNRIREGLWRVVGSLVFAPWWLHLPELKIAILKQFGSRIGKGVVIKPSVRITFPWRLQIGDRSWIGEGVWIDNLAMVEIGRDCCISQGSYLCTGNHDWSCITFNLITKPIAVEDEVWLGAKSVVGPGVTVGNGAVLAIGSVATKDLKSGWIYSGNPAVAVRRRESGRRKTEIGDQRSEVGGRISEDRGRMPDVGGQRTKS